MFNIFTYNLKIVISVSPSSLNPSYMFPAPLKLIASLSLISIVMHTYTHEQTNKYIIELVESI